MKKLKSVLLIDDSKATNDLNQYHIRSLDLTDDIVVRLNGAEALQYLKEGNELPDLILLDIKMPVMGGFEFLEEFEKLFGNTTLSVIIVMLSSSSSPNDLERAEANLLVSSYYKKPLNRAVLEEIIERFFK